MADDQLAKAPAAPDSGPAGPAGDPRQDAAALAAFESGKVSAGSWWMLFVLFLLYVLSLLDRQVLSMLVEPIKLDLQLTDAEGNTLPTQRDTIGHLWVKGASVIERYFKSDDDVLDGEGYFDTGDLAMIDADGNLTLCGRSKDLIKSGGEWINPNEIEAIIGRDPSVRHVAVIGRPDDRWGERPVLIVEMNPGGDPQRLIGLLRGKIADWWVPAQVAEVATMPLAASGKIDKNRLRADDALGKLGAAEAVR